MTDEKASLQIQNRTVSRRSYLRALRKQGLIPGVIYGQGGPSQAVTADSKAVGRLMNTRGKRGLFTLQVEGESKPVYAMIKEMQIDPLNGAITHLDFIRIMMNERMQSRVTVIISGEEEASAGGATVQIGLREIEIECMPADLPDHLQIDISSLAVGQQILVRDLKLSEGVTLLADPEAVVVEIVPAHVVTEASAEAETEA